MKKVIILSFFIFLGISTYAQNNLVITDKGYLYGYTKPYFVCDDGVLYTVKKSNRMALIKFPQNKQASTYTIPDGVTIIARGAFQGNKHLKTIRIPSSVEYIGDNAFTDCDQLQSIEIYNSTTAVRAVDKDDDYSENKEVGRYNIQGVKIEEGADGQVQIILYSDGTSKKVFD